MKTVIRKIAIIVWYLYIAGGVIFTLAGTPQLGALLAVPAVLGILVTYEHKPKQYRPTDELMDNTDAAPVVHVQRTEQPAVSAAPARGSVSVSAVKMRERITASDYIVLDVETTGLSEDTDEIIEVAAIRVSGGRVVDQYESLVHPRRLIPPNITDLTGITNRDVRSAPAITEVMQALDRFWPEGIPAVAHNAPFDLKFVGKALCAAGCSREIQYIDTLPLARDAFPGLPDYKLNTLISVLCLSEDEQEHRAMSDVEYAHKLYLRCVEAISASDDYRYTGPVRPSDVHRTVEDIDPTHPLYGKNIVFTGDLSISRREAMQLAVNVGAAVKSTVSSKTDYLVVGVQDTAVVGKDGMSSKEEKAQGLNDCGKAHIRVIREGEFMLLIKGGVMAK